MTQEPANDKRAKYALILFTTISVILIIVWGVFGNIIYGVFFMTALTFVAILIGYSVAKQRRRNLALANSRARINPPSSVTHQQRIFVVSPANARPSRRHRVRRHRELTAHTNTPGQRNYIYEYPPDSGNFVIDQGRTDFDDFGPIVRRTGTVINSTEPVHQNFRNNSPYNQNVNSHISFPSESINSSERANQNSNDNQIGFGALPEYSNPDNGNLSELKLYGLDDLPPSYGDVMEQKAKEVPSIT